MGHVSGHAEIFVDRTGGLDPEPEEVASTDEAGRVLLLEGALHVDPDRAPRTIVGADQDIDGPVQAGGKAAAPALRLRPVRARGAQEGRPRLGGHLCLGTIADDSRRGVPALGAGRVRDDDAPLPVRVPAMVSGVDVDHSQVPVHGDSAAVVLGQGLGRRSRGQVFHLAAVLGPGERVVEVRSEYRPRRSEAAVPRLALDGPREALDPLELPLGVGDDGPESRAQGAAPGGLLQSPAWRKGDGLTLIGRMRRKRSTGRLRNWASP